MKKTYETPMIEVTELKSESVITLSGFNEANFKFDTTGTNEISF